MQWLVSVGESQEHIESHKSPYLRRNAYPSLYLEQCEDMSCSHSESVHFDPSNARITYEKQNEAGVNCSEINAEELNHASPAQTAKLI